MNANTNYAGNTRRLRLTRRQRDQQLAYSKGFDARRKYNDGAACHYRKAWLREAWSVGFAAAGAQR